MAASVVVTCPECEKKFKPKTDVAGKKIKCPFCGESFVVPVAAEAKPDQARGGKPKPAESKAASGVAAPQPAATQAKAPDDDDDGNPDPYGVKTIEVVSRCPECTEEMGPHDTICLACGYNTMTRAWGKTVKTLGLTLDRHLLYLLPAMGAAVFVLFSVIFLLYYAVVSPYHVDKTMMEFSDHESMRMWTSVIFLAWLWGAGMFCFKKFIEKPKPEEIEMTEDADQGKKKKAKAL